MLNQLPLKRLIATFCLNQTTAIIRKFAGLCLVDQGFARRGRAPGTIFIQFAEAISELHDYRVFHFGNYDVAVLRRIAARLPKELQEQFETIIRNCFNVLSLVHSYIYFPTYANSLKKIISCLRGDFYYEGPAGLDSVVWRTQWENTEILVSRRA